MERTHLTSDMFNLYLHQNYLEFFSDMDDLVGTNLYSRIQDTCFSLSMECYSRHYLTTDNGKKALLFSSFSFQASVCEHFSGADFMTKEWMVMFFRLYPAPHPPPPSIPKQTLCLPAISPNLRTFDGNFFFSNVINK